MNNRDRPRRLGLGPLPPRLRPQSRPRPLEVLEGTSRTVDVMDVSSDDLVRELQEAAQEKLGYSRSVSVAAEIGRRLEAAERAKAQRPVEDSVEFVTPRELQDFFRVSAGTSYRIMSQLGAALIGSDSHTIYRAPIEAVQRFYGAEVAFKLVVFIKGREQARGAAEVNGGHANGDS